MPTRPELEAIQRFMLAAVSHEDGLEAGLDSSAARAAAAGREVEDLILPAATLTARERLGIYADMYYWRLIDVLAEDHRRLRDFLGAAEFGRLARAYLHRHPSRHPNLAHLGAGFADFLRDEAEEVSMRGLAVDLARLERAFSRVFDAKEDPVIAAEDLLAIDPEERAELCLEPISALELLRLDHALPGWLDDDMPAAAPPEPRACHVLVYRRDYEVFRLDLTPAQAACLEAIIAGENLLEALVRAAECQGLELETMAPRFEPWFRSWTALGLFRGLRA